MATGQDLTDLAATRLGEKYRNITVPKDHKDWHGPWDCAEFASWVAFQVTGTLFGCLDNGAPPSIAEAYSGAWVRDAKDGTLIASTLAEAVGSAGVLLIRRPPGPMKMGHVAISDGAGRTVEAAGLQLGVRRMAVQGRVWDFVAKLPGVAYSPSGHHEVLRPEPFVLRLQMPNVSGPRVRKVQQALRALGFEPGKIDGEYGPHTVAAVTAFQMERRLVADGMVGPKTAAKLGIDWPE